MNFRHSISKTLAAILLLTVPAMSARADVADGAREFVQRLSDRGLFELAEQFCLRQFSSLNNPDERAEWELILSECQQQHAWHMDDDSRMGMIHQSAQRISEFLKSNTPAAEHDIRLRVRQLELIVAAGQMEAIVHSPLSRMSPDASPAGKDRDSKNRRPIRSIPLGTQRILESIQQAEISSHALMKQIDEIRKEIDSDVGRMARERIRLALTELAFAKVRLSSPAERAELIEQTEAMAEPLVKSVTDDRLRFRVRMLMAETRLANNDFAAFKLRFGNLASIATTPDEKASVAAIRIRALLQQDQPSDALQEFVNASQNDLALTQELQVLRLQSLLQLMELLSQLDPSQQKTDLEQKTANEFRQLQDKTISLTSGVWRQRCVRLVEHFDRVLQVGPEAAYTLESAAALVESGDLKGARALLQTLLSGAGTKQPRNSAALLMQSGHLSIRLQDWTAAATDIKRAKEFYNSDQDRAGAAAADLLRIYVLGQQWNLDPAAGITEDTYKTAINEHLQAFADQPTVPQAREWRARLLTNSDPQQAAAEMLALVAESKVDHDVTNAVTDAATNHLNLLSLAGDLLLEAVAVHALNPAQTSAEDTDRWKSITKEFAAECSRVQAWTSEPHQHSLALLRAQQTGLILFARMGPDSNWKTIDATARDCLVAVSPTVPAEPGHPEQNPSEKVSQADLEKATAHARQVCHAIIVLSSFRQLADLTQSEEARTALLSLAITQRLRTAQLLMRQLPSPGPVIPGDGPLAGFLIELISLPNNDPENDSTELRLRRLQLLQPLGRAAGTMAAFDHALDDLMRSNLSDTQLTALMEIINQASHASIPKAALLNDGTLNHGTLKAGLPKAGNQAATTRRFWQTLYKRSKPGDDRWLEASLQLAILAEADGQTKESAKILAVVSVLHPNWGTPVRKAKADELRKRLEKAP